MSMIRITILAACSFLLLVTLDLDTVSAREPYWEEHHIELSGLTEEQVLGLESTINQLRSLEPGELKINRSLHGRLSRFKELFGFPFNGKDLSGWLLARIRSISYQNTWTVAVNQNQGSFMVGDFFFTKTTPLEKLYALIHEARHSDNDGYKHIRCPDGFKYISSRQPEMDLEQEAACDANDQGAYSFQAAFLFELFAYGLLDQGEAGLLYNSSISRVVPPK
ncbi:MAG: hypothetical protein HY283_10035 [Nitrospirae bacterium]|nr:hypothetical protein [Nitrospirota bacterium]